MTWKRFLEWLLRVLNLVLTVVGLAVLGYGVYLLEVYKHVPDDNLVKLGTTLDKWPKAWFLYLLTGIGVVLSVVSCCGCLASLTRNRYCLSCYAILVSLVVLVELLCAAYIYFDGTWEDKVPTDNTGNFDTIYEFLEDHWETLQWVALAMLILEVFVLFLALAVRALNRPHAQYDSDEEYIVPKQQNGSTPVAAAALDQHLLSRNNAWIARMREKYGLDTTEFSYNRSDSTRKHEAAEERGGCTIM